MGQDFGKGKEDDTNEKTHNVDIAYDYRFFFDYMKDNIHKDCAKYLQPYKIDPKESDRKVLIQYFESVSNEDLNKYSKSLDINASLRCYCLDGLVIRYLTKDTDKNNDDNKERITSSSDEPKYETNDLCELLMVESIKSMLMDNDSVSLAEGLFGMNSVYMLPFHHILQYLSPNINNHIQNYMFSKYKIVKDNSSFIDKMNEINNNDDAQNEQKQAEQGDDSDDVNKINYEMIFKLLENNALRNQSTENYQLLNKMMVFHQDSNNEKLSLKYIPIIAMYKNENDILFIESMLNQGPSKKAWFAAMNAIQYFPNPTFWNYLQVFFKKIYTHISLVNGETVPIDLKQALDDKQKEEEKEHGHNHPHKHQHEHGEEEKDDEKEQKSSEPKVDAALLTEGQSEIKPVDNDEGGGDGNEEDDIDNNNNMDYKSLIDESQYYDISTQMTFIKSLCIFSVYDPLKYSESVNAAIHHLLDIPKANTNNGYYEENMSYLLQCIPLHSSMKSIIFRIWQVYGVCDWRYLNILIYESCLSKISFKQFLLGTHKRIGKESNILKIAGEQGILKNIYSFLNDDIYDKSMETLSNSDNIIWWSPIKEESKYIMDTLKCIENLFNALNLSKHKSRFELYQKFKQKHNSRIIEKYISPKFDSILVK